MDYCTAHFGKSIGEITIKDIGNYFLEERTETDQSEFKSVHGAGSLSDKFPGVQRTVCAFLNSSGGLLIWGAPVGQKFPGRKEKIFKGDLTYFDQVIEKDFIISKISDSITPLPNGIRAKILSDAGKSIVLIEVDSSDYAPHQYADTYFMRIDGQTKPAPHHYIEALFRRITYPNIEVFLRINKADVFEERYRVDFSFIFFNWSPLQNEENLSFRVVCDGVFANSINSWDRNYRGNGHEFFKERTTDVFYYGEPMEESNIILFDPYKVSEKENKGRLFIGFGGKFSPLKRSDYILDMTKIYASNPNDMIIKRDENRLIKDIQDEKGVTKESVIKTYLEGFKK